VFFGSHDPTTKNGQHPDYGTQYRSIAFYSTDSEKKIIEAAITKLNQEIYSGKIVTEITKHTKFYKAEDYHQDYEKRNPNQGYVKAVSIPRLNKFKNKFPELLKKEAK
jgi:peptide-methionine (S)-S-oxide reductase